MFFSRKARNTRKVQIKHPTAFRVFRAFREKPFRVFRAFRENPFRESYVPLGLLETHR
jgi:hypothetical protein